MMYSIAGCTYYQRLGPAGAAANCSVMKSDEEGFTSRDWLCDSTGTTRAIGPLDQSEAFVNRWLCTLLQGPARLSAFGLVIRVSSWFGEETIERLRDGV